MSEVLKFPKIKRQMVFRSLPGAAEKQADQGEDFADAKTPSILGRAFRFFFSAITTTLFVVMLWLRGIVVGICSLVSVLMLFSLILGLFVSPDKSAMLWGFGIISFVSFVIMFCYDCILMALSPHDMVRTL